MEKTFETIVTDIGTRLIAQAAAEGKKIDIAYLAVGDGNGAYYKPVPSMTSLKNEKWRGPRNSVSLDAKTPNVIDVVAIVPPDVGGWTIREMCILDADGNMIAICNTPDTEKTIAAAGAAGEVELIMQIKISSTAAISFVIDPNVITATKEDVERHTADTTAHITTAERTAWNGRATTEDVERHAADTAAHVATAIHTRAGTTHNLAVEPSAKNLTFLATAGIGDKDTWTVNGQPVTAMLRTGRTPLPATLFAPGSWVTGVRLSDDGKKLTFPGTPPIAYDAESIQSALTVSTSAPSSYIGDGKIWGVY